LTWVLQTFPSPRFPGLCFKSDQQGMAFGMVATKAQKKRLKMLGAT
jgi:hypothetical protein